MHEPMPIPIRLSVAEHDLLDLQPFVVEFHKPLGETKTPDSILSLLATDAAGRSPFDTLTNESQRDVVKSKIRDVFRGSGYKPTGRGKPASEYLMKAVSDNKLSSINPVVDTCNVASLHSGVPISVVDLALCRETLQVAVSPPETEYVFNTSGQTIKLDGLLCLFDAEGACANAVKDSQRTKTSESTTRVLTLVWGSRELPALASKTAAWFQELLKTAELATIQPVDCSASS